VKVREQMILLVALGCGLVAMASSALAGPGHVNFMIGQKLFDSDEWDPIDKQSSFGVEGAFGPGRWPVQMAAYLSRASGEEATSYSGTQFNLDATTYEIGIGLNKTFTAGKIYPYVGAGLVHAKVDFTAQQSGTSASDEGSGFGGWGGAGLFYRVGSTFNLGAAARYSSVDVDFNAYTSTSGVPIPGGTIDAGGFTFGVLVGWGWPKTP